MVEKLDFDADPNAIRCELDEATLAAIDRGIKSADEGRVVTLEEAYQRMEQWTTKSSSLKTR